MNKQILLCLLLFFQLVVVKAQFTDTLTIVELIKGEPNAYQVVFEKQHGYYRILYGTKREEEKPVFSDIKNGISRFIVKDENEEFTVYLVKPFNTGSYLFMEIRFIESLVQAKLCIPDEKLFSLAFTREGLEPYFKRPELKEFTKQDALAFLAYQQNTFEALKNFSDYLIINTSLKKSFKNSREVYAAFRDKMQDLAYLRWLNSKGYHGGSYMTLIFKIMESLLDKEVEAKAINYTEKENAFFKQD